MLDPKGGEDQAADAQSPKHWDMSGQNAVIKELGTHGQYG